MSGGAMIDRLANVIYWLSCAIALAIVLMSLGSYWFMFVNDRLRGEGPLMAGAFLASSILVWGIGRAIRYVLSGR